MLRQDVERSQPVFDPAAGGDAGSDYRLFAAVVYARPECESPVARRADRPAREAPRDLDHVFLGVPAVDSERVQLHQLARIIFIQPRASRLRQRIAVGVELRRRRGLLHLTQEVVEVVEHRRALRHCRKQVFESAERVGADHVALIRCQQPSVDVLLAEDVEVVEPEIDHHLLQLLLAEDGAQEFRLLQFAQRLLRVARGLLLLLRWLLRLLRLRRRHLLLRPRLLWRLRLHRWLLRRYLLLLRLLLGLRLHQFARVGLLDFVRFDVRRGRWLSRRSRGRSRSRSRSRANGRRFIGLQNFKLGHLQSAERQQWPREKVVGQILRMKLRFDVLLYAHPPHALDVALARAEAGAIEQVQDLLILGQLRRRGRRAPAAPGRRYVRGQRDQSLVDEGPGGQIGFERGDGRRRRIGRRLLRRERNCKDKRERKPADQNRQ